MLLEDLYRHSVERARLGPLLEQLDDALGALCQATPKELHAGAGGLSCLISPSPLLPLPWWRGHPFRNDLAALPVLPAPCKYLNW